MTDPLTEGSPIGAMLDDVGVTVELDDGQRIVDAVVIARTVNFAAERGEPRTGLVISTSEGLDWITELGLITAARTMIETSTAGVCDDGDDFV